MEQSAGRMGWLGVGLVAALLLLAAACGGGTDESDVAQGPEVEKQDLSGDGHGGDAVGDATEATAEGLPQDPCKENPCTEAPAAVCDEDGVTLVEYTSPGTCTAVEGQAECEYPEALTDCSQSQQVCQNGVCVNPVDPCTPNPCNTPPPNTCKDGTTQLFHPVPGQCEDVEGAFKCTYAAEEKACQEPKPICLAGECVEPPSPCAANPCNAPPEDFCKDEATLMHHPSPGLCTEVEGQADCSYEPAEVNCAADGQKCLDGACKFEGEGNLPKPGEVLITEFMAKSQAGSGDKGEWVEFYNTTLETLDLNTCLLEGETDNHLIAALVLVGPGEFVVLARSDKPEETHGVVPDYVYTGFTLANDKDSITLLCGKDESENPKLIDTVAYDKTLVFEGAAAQLDPDSFDPVANDAEQNWCAADQQFGIAGKLGTPGAANTQCPEPGPCNPNPCTTGPADECTPDGLSIVKYSDDGTCEIVDNNPKCAYPTTEVACTDGKVCTGGKCVTPPPDPCEQNPCTEPPAPVCGNDGDSTVPYVTPGKCTNVGGKASCEYSAGIPVPCAAETFCKDGLCMPDGIGVLPKAGEVIFTEFMAKSQAGSGDKGEWVELVNLAQLPLDLGGCTLKDTGTDSHVIAGSLVVKAGATVLLARSAVPEENHGLEPDYVYVSFSLTNDADEMILECATLEIDKVEYAAAQATEGIAWQLDPDAFGAALNDSMDNWCEATLAYGTAGKLGTPGDENVQCPDPCDPNPCTTPDAAVCDADGKTLHGFEPTGVCSPAGKTFSCKYTPKDTDCNKELKICKNGACAPFNPCDPNPCTTPDAAVCDADGKTLHGWEPTGVCTPNGMSPSCQYAAKDTDCSAVGKVCKNGGCEVPVYPLPANAGDVIITEFMAKSQASSDPGEWVELYNPTAGTFSLAGCILKDKGADKHTFGALTIGPGKYLLLAKSAVPAENHGLPEPLYKYSSFSLANTPDSIILECNAKEIDGVDYTESWIKEGIAFQLNPSKLSAEANNLVENWCVATAEYGTAKKKGTPGAANTACLKVGWCRLQHPLSESVVASYQGYVYGRLFVDGVTNKSNASDPDAAVLGQVGFGPDKSNPAAKDSTWQWSAALPNPLWTDGEEPNNDEYMGQLKVSVVGVHDFAYRFSADGGVSWTYCDKAAGQGADGSENGYQADNAGSLEIKAN